MKKKTYKTTKADFEYFKRHCEWWVKYLSLFEYRYDYRHMKLKSSIAVWEVAYQNRWCAITLNTDMGDFEITREELAKAAFHEVFESSLAERLTMAAYTGNNLTVEQESHTIVRRMEHTLFQDKWETTLKRMK